MTLSGDPESHAHISRAARGRIARGGALEGTIRALQLRNCLDLCLLVVWERISTDAAVKERHWIRVFFHRAKVEDPVVLSVSMLQEALRIISMVSVESFHSSCWKAHYDYSVGYIDQIKFNVEMCIFKTRFVARYDSPYEVGHWIIM